jgi:hypothetical protein
VIRWRALYIAVVLALAVETLALWLLERWA